MQDTWNAQVDRSHTIRVWEESVVAGMLQTPDYARHMFTLYAELHGLIPDTEAAVRSRMKRQEWLYRSGGKLRVIMWEAALHALICPPSVLATQLDRLTGAIGMDTVELGIVPFGASLKIPAANGFWIFDDRLVITEDWHAELWVDDNVGLATYLRVWDTLRESACTAPTRTASLRERAGCSPRHDVRSGRSALTPPRNVANAPAVTASSGPCGILESRMPVVSPAKATSTQLSPPELKLLFTQWAAFRSALLVKLPP